MMTLLFLVIGFVFFLSLFNHDWQDRHPHYGGYPPPPPPVYYPQPMPYPYAYGREDNRNALPATIAFISLLILGMWYFNNKAEQEEAPSPRKVKYQTRAEKRELEEKARYIQQETTPCPPCKCDCANQI